MLTLRAAATLLATATTPDALTGLIAVLGFTGPAHPLDDDGCRAIGLDPARGTARIARGVGLHRALVVALTAEPSGTGVRETVTRVAAGLARRSPHLEWLAVVAERAGPHIALATWSPERVPPRTAALVVDRRRVMDSDAETVCALAAAANDGPAAAARWLTVLGRDGLSARFYRALERSVAGLAASATDTAGGRPVAGGDRRALAVLYTSRLLFLAFLEGKGWLDGDRGFLGHSFAQCVADTGDYHGRVLRPLFFGTLNTPLRDRASAARAFGRIPFLNGGLFAPTALDRRYRTARFADAAFGQLFGDCLERHRFTAREDRQSWSEAAIDPEMLGRAFESLMSADARRATGAHYTPQPLVAHVTEIALGEALAVPPTAPVESVLALLRDGTATPEVADAVRGRAAAIRILDPACGSGAFLVHALERVSDLLARTGDARALSAIRRAVLLRSIFGVDVNPIAVWLCELRLWLSVVIDSDEADPLRATPLPTLDRHVRAGDALAGDGFDGDGTEAGHDRSAAGRIAALRGRYARAMGPGKRTILRALERAEREHALALIDHRSRRIAAARRELLVARRSNDLFGQPVSLPRALRERATHLRRTARALRARRAALRAGAALPFAFATGFADARAAGGFDVVLGNPPWIRSHVMPPTERARLRATFRAARDAAWMHGATVARAGRGFASQVDTSALFVERSLSLCTTHGVVSLLLPAKLWRALSGGGLRRLLIEHSELLALEDWSEAAHAFEATVYPSLLLVRRSPSPSPLSSLLSPLSPAPAPARRSIH